MKKNLDVLDKIIVGRVEPHIYAFSTNTIPNYLKVGDTYRPVNVRLKEWKKFYPNLHKEFEGSATIDDKVFFRDYSVHQYLEQDLNKHRLNQNDIPASVYYSNEFFRDTSVIDVKSAINDIEKSYRKVLRKYLYYESKGLLAKPKYKSTGMWKLRPNQKEVVDNFKNAVSKGRTNLLMYAVMRFGKSFTAMCCANKLDDCNVVVIVSAKADVKNEWKRTIEEADNFKNYDFIDTEDLYVENKIRDTLKENKKAAIFLTLEDLQGSEIKEKHKELFKTKIDLLIIDETHFGARAEKYGEVLREKDVDSTFDDEDKSVEDVNKAINKTLNARVRIHLSGTPYRILMGSEFTKEDIIAFCQFSDIVDEQNKWDKEHFENIELENINPETSEKYEPWDNPYYGFPEMIRFAFNPNKSSRKKLEELKKDGVTYAFSELFKPQSIKKDDNGLYKKFKYENEILELLEVIDGSKDDDELLGFLNYDKIKQGKMCHHIVCVLPYCASCDALENLILKNKKRFKNLNQYEIINISGVNIKKQYKSIGRIKSKIKDCEENGIKTLTLTVNRMLTGSTVPEWDTMLYFKDTSSPQEYDQATFRLQNQFIKEYVSDNGEIIKYNMKPQTLLVDFDPNRMFKMQELKSQIYNYNTEKNGNSKLKDRIEKELTISPIITINSGKIKEIKASDIMLAISNYSKDRGVMQEANEIPVDLNLLNYDLIKHTIGMQSEFGSKDGFSLFNTDDEDTDDLDTLSNDTEQNVKNKLNNNLPSKNNDSNKSLINKFKTYYSRILFFAFLTKAKVISVSDIVDVIDKGENQRIAHNLDLDKNVLYLFKNMNPFTLSQLDYKIENMNELSNDPSLSTYERAMVANLHFDKLSEAEIITPSNICMEMIKTISKNDFVNIIRKNGKILDIASKKGEFALNIYNYLHNNKNLQIKNSIYSIPTSKLAYEFTRKIYESLGLNINNISSFTTYDLLKFRHANQIDTITLNNIILQNKLFSKIDINNRKVSDNTMKKFDLVLGNPPYQENISNRGEQPPIYNLFYDSAISLSDNVCFITPARFLFDAGKTPKEWNKKMLNDNHFRVIDYYSNSKEIFNNVDIKGGVAITSRNAEKDYGKIETYIQNDTLRNILKNVKNECGSFVDSILYSNTSYKYSKLFYQENPDFLNRVSGGSRRYLSSSSFEKFPEVFYEKKPNDNEQYIEILGRKNNKRLILYMKSKYIIPPENIDNYKVFLASSNGTGKLGESLSEPILGYPNLGATETFVSFGSFNNKIECENLIKYFKTKFARILLGTKKVTQGNKNPDVWSNVPLLDFSTKSDIDWSLDIDKIDYQLYKKFHLSNEEIDFIETTATVM